MSGLEGTSRRGFLGAGVTVAAAVALSLTPGGRALVAAATGVPAALGAAPQGDWHVDDICGHMPRYAHPIPYLHESSAPGHWALAAPVDWQFVG
jgi:hypothetical protein